MGHLEKSSIIYSSMKLVFYNKISVAVVIYMSPDSERLGTAVEACVGSNFTQPSDISHFYLYIFF